MKNVILLIVAFFIFHSCQNSQVSKDSDLLTDISEMNIRDVSIAIDREVTDASADDVSKCNILPIGEKPCGGPWGYLVYSKEVSDTSKLKNLVERYNQLDNIRNKEEELISPCDMAQAPNLILENGSCTGQGSYAWNPGTILEKNYIEAE